MAKRESKLNLEECAQAVAMFFQKQRKFKQVQTQFGEIKANFYNDMENYFECNDIEGKLSVDCGLNLGVVNVTRIQNTNIEFNPVKL